MAGIRAASTAPLQVLRLSRRTPGGRRPFAANYGLIFSSQPAGRWTTIWGRQGFLNPATALTPLLVDFLEAPPMLVVMQAAAYRRAPKPITPSVQAPGMATATLPAGNPEQVSGLVQTLWQAEGKTQAAAFFADGGPGG